MGRRVVSCGSVGKPRSLLEGARILATVALALVLLTAVAKMVGGATWTLWLTRATARTSLALFVVTFAASSIHRLVGGSPGKWLLRNRRVLGLSFALSHAVHAAAFFGYAAHRGESIAAFVAPTTLVGGSVGYVFIAAMAATSTDAMRRRLGGRAWVALHKTGMYALFGIFVFSYLGPALVGRPLGIAATLGLLSGLGLRIFARLKRRSR